MLLNSAAHQDPKYLEALLECRENAELTLTGPEHRTDIIGQSPWKSSSSAIAFQQDTPCTNPSTKNHKDGLSHPVPDGLVLESLDEEFDDDTVTLTFDPYPPSKANNFRSADEFQSWPPNMPSSCRLQLDLLRSISHQVQGEVAKSVICSHTRRNMRVGSKQLADYTPRQQTRIGKDLSNVNRYSQNEQPCRTCNSRK